MERFVTPQISCLKLGSHHDVQLRKLVLEHCALARCRQRTRACQHQPAWGQGRAALSGWIFGSQKFADVRMWFWIKIRSPPWCVNQTSNFVENVHHPLVRWFKMINPDSLRSRTTNLFCASKTAPKWFDLFSRWETYAKKMQVGLQPHLTLCFFIYIYINDISKCTYIAPSILVGLIIPFRQVIWLLLCLLHPCQAHLQRALEKIEKETPLRPTKFGFVTVENLRQNTEKHQFNHHSTY